MLAKPLILVSVAAVLAGASGPVCAQSGTGDRGSVSAAESEESVLAFPSAEGYGKYTQGGRGGAVYEVTNLKDSGEGSLRAAVEASGPRTVVFRVSGTIELESPLVIENPYITIAGQTAPGDGIAIKDYPLQIGADEVILRYVRARLGDESDDDADAIGGRYVTNVIVDHVSASWSIDETVSIYHADSVTVQWSLVSESLYDSHHAKETHGYGAIWGGNHSTYHHNLLAHHSSRNPRFASGSGHTDFRNNVIYNWGFNSVYGGENQQPGNDELDFSTINVIANYYKPGPATERGVRDRIAAPSARGRGDEGRWYVAENVVVGDSAVTADNWLGVDGDEFVRLENPWSSMAIDQQTAAEAYQSVLENAGATVPTRDAVDTRIIEEVRTGNATYEGGAYRQHHSLIDPSQNSGIIDSQGDVGGWPELESAAPPTDSDHDGMPDAWERAHGLNPNDATDRNTRADDGYTMLEKYLNSLMDGPEK
jgi:pectate lyase